LLVFSHLERHFRRLTGAALQAIKDEKAVRKTMRSEGRLSPQRPQRLRSEKRALPKLFLAHSKPAKVGSENRQREKQTTPLRRPVSF